MLDGEDMGRGDRDVVSNGNHGSSCLPQYWHVGHSGRRRLLTRRKSGGSWEGLLIIFTFEVHNDLGNVTC